MSAGHAVYLLGAVATHAVVGYTLARLWTAAPAVSGAVGAVVPDLDLGILLGTPLGLAHRGVVHTPAFVLVLGVALAAPARTRRFAPGVVVGGASHLLIESLTKSGIMWLFPLDTTHYGLPLGVHGFRYDALVALVCAALLLWPRLLARPAREAGERPR